MQNNEKENVFVGMTDVGQAEKVLNQYLRDYPQNLSEAEELLEDLLAALAAADNLTGCADDFHNFAVSISRLTDDSRKALNIVEAGLAIHPMNTDLLADAINYGSNCNERKKCADWYNTLQSIDKARWTWRSFSFSITYMLDEWTSAGRFAYEVDDILRLAKDYQRMIPDEEDAWFSEYKIYAGVNQKEKGIEVLRSAIDRFDFCPRCWLRFADIMVDRGRYDEAKPIVRKLCRNPKTKETVNSSFMYLLDAQCKLNDFYHSDAYDCDEVDEKEIFKLYRAFRKVLRSQDLREGTKKTVEGYIEDLTSEFDIDFPDEWRYAI